MGKGRERKGEGRGRETRPSLIHISGYATGVVCCGPGHASVVIGHSRHLDGSSDGGVQAW